MWERQYDMTPDDFRKKKNYLPILALLFLVLIALPLAVFLVRGSQDIRPRAVTGQANLLLLPDRQSLTVGSTFDVSVRAALTDSRLRISGADITLLYDKRKLSVTRIKPNISASGDFTEAPTISEGDPFDNTFDKLRLAVVSSKGNGELSGGSVEIATITFEAKLSGDAVVKFPDDKSVMEISGIRI